MGGDISESKDHHKDCGNLSSIDNLFHVMHKSPLIFCFVLGHRLHPFGDMGNTFMKVLPTKNFHRLPVKTGGIYALEKGGNGVKIT